MDRYRISLRGNEMGFTAIASTRRDVDTWHIDGDAVRSIVESVSDHIKLGGGGAWRHTC